MILDKHLKQPHQTSVFNLPIIISLLFWFLFLGNLGYLAYQFPNMPKWDYQNFIRINGFTLVIWTTVTFFSAILSSYASNYLQGFRYQNRFMMLCTGFTFSVMLFIASNHIALLLVSWFVMGIFMAKLIGVNTSWREAKEASKFAQKYFFTGGIFLSAGVLLLAFQSSSHTLTEINAKVYLLPQHMVLIAAILIIIAAIIQSAIYPFHRWLLSAMTAPTPASALMHAGFVNGSGILLSLFATTLFASNTLNILFIVGGITAIIAQFAKLIQVNAKQKLGCSTIAQMGFMIMQCGLGFFNAAVVHLILHGFYKACLFLSAGENIGYQEPENAEKIKITPFQALVVLIYGLLGAFLFMQLTGKGIAINSSIFLTLIVAITVGQITYNIVKQKSLSPMQKAIVPPVLFFIGIGLYALVYKAVSLCMADTPMTDVALPLSGIQIIVGIIFLTGFFIMKLGIYQKIPWLYVKLLNDSQPAKNTVLMFKNHS
ncbi:proton-conducting transporter membrane subunit [Pedobacter glucosidilyticus]|uniref:proton-conducting transporter transmembrane domain-containing protein n=1 Tax=Pedobacter glucosidilyticus TaxID=1122941 RepID=UPI0039C9C49F